MRLAKYAKVSLIKEMDTPELLPDIGHQWLAGSDASPSLAFHSAPAGPLADGHTSSFLKTKRLLNVHHTPHAAHACIFPDFTESENGTLDHLTQSQLV
ncbi:hypothetical protein EV715DRAFT_297430 [Schizophyllum commune]